MLPTPPAAEPRAPPAPAPGPTQGFGPPQQVPFAEQARPASKSKGMLIDVGWVF